MPKGMHEIHEIHEVRLRPVPNGSDGLISFASCRYGNVVLNDIAIRKDPSGHLYLSFPRKLSSTGRPHPLHHPIDRQTVAQFEEAIIGALRRLVGGAGVGAEVSRGTKGAFHD